MVQKLSPTTYFEHGKWIPDINKTMTVQHGKTDTVRLHQDDSDLQKEKDLADDYMKQTRKVWSQISLKKDLLKKKRLENAATSN